MRTVIGSVIGAILGYMILSTLFMSVFENIAVMMIKEQILSGTFSGLSLQSPTENIIVAKLLGGILLGSLAGVYFTSLGTNKETIR